MKHKKTIEQVVINFIEKNELLKKNSKVLIALSGGADSVFALHFFLKYSKKFRLKLAALHVDHTLRGGESDRDESFCKNLCNTLKVEYYSSKIDVRTFAKRNKKSLEEAARELRYKELTLISAKCEADYIVTAHNRDDNTETVLLNLFSGSGIEGISGIPVRRGDIIRPFLAISKYEIIGYLREHRFDFVLDSSNENVEFNRNFLRKEVIPTIREHINPALDKVILNSSEIFRKQGEIIKHYSQEAYTNCVSIKEKFIIIHLNKLSYYPSELRSEVFKLIFNRFLDKDFSYSNSLKLSNLITSQVGTKINLGNKIFAIRERSKIVIGRELNRQKINFEISIGEKVKFNDLILRISRISRLPKQIKNTPKTEYIEGDLISGKMKIRPWKKGDKIQLLGMKGTKKISDVLTDLKISSVERSDKLVLEYEDEIIWLVGHRISEKFKVKKTTNTILKLCLD